MLQKQGPDPILSSSTCTTVKLNDGDDRPQDIQAALFFYSGVNWKITTKTGILYQCTVSWAKDVLTMFANTLPDYFSFNDNDHIPYI